MGLYHEILPVLYCAGVHGDPYCSGSSGREGFSGTIVDVNLSTDHKRLSTSLHHILTMTTKGKALRVVQQADPGNGYLAWWRLRTEMVPQVSGRLLGVLQTLLSVRFESEDRLLVELNEWERNVLLYEQQSGEEMSGSIKRAVSQQSLPADLRQALQSKTNIDSYADFRAALRDDVLARKAWRSGPVPMEIGAVQEYQGKSDRKNGLLIDSGAELHVCPPGFHEEYPVVRGTRELVSISGEPLHYYGERRVKTAISGGSAVVPVSVVFFVSDVTAPVLSWEKWWRRALSSSSQSQRVAGCRRML